MPFLRVATSKLRMLVEVEGFLLSAYLVWGSDNRVAGLPSTRGTGFAVKIAVGRAALKKGHEESDEDRKMDSEHLDDEEIFKSLCSDHVVPWHDLRRKLRADKLNLAILTTRLRKWAVQQKHILRVLLGYNCSGYSVVVMIEFASPQALQDAHSQLESLHLFGERPAGYYIVGPDHANAPMFFRPGQYDVWAAAKEISAIQAA